MTNLEKRKITQIEISKKNH